MSTAPDWLPVVAAAYDSGEDAWASDGAAVHRVRGGANNALYRVEIDGPDRERLTRPVADPVQSRSRLLYFIEREGRFAHRYKRTGR